MFRYFVAFGSLLGMSRFDSIMPWDDDIDLAIDGAHVGSLLQGLPLTRVDGRWWKCRWWCIERVYACKCDRHYDLGGGARLLHKNWGVPFKVYLDNRHWIFVDISTYTYETDSTSNEIFASFPREQTKTGHTKSNIRASTKSLLPFQSLSYYVGDYKFHVNVPSNVSSYLIQTYRDLNVINDCRTSYMHGTCQYKDCPNPISPYMPAVKFPCGMLKGSLEERRKSRQELIAKMASNGTNAPT